MHCTWLVQPALAAIMAAMHNPHIVPQTHSKYTGCLPPVLTSLMASNACVCSRVCSARSAGRAACTGEGGG